MKTIAVTLPISGAVAHVAPDCKPETLAALSRAAQLIQQAQTVTPASFDDAKGLPRGIYGRIYHAWPDTILNLDSAVCIGVENQALPNPEAVRAFLATHPEVTSVNFAATHMPRRPVPVAKLTDAMLRKYYRPARVCRMRVEGGEWVDGVFHRDAEAAL